MKTNSSEIYECSPLTPSFLHPLVLPCFSCHPPQTQRLSLFDRFRHPAGASTHTSPTSEQNSRQGNKTISPTQLLKGQKQSQDSAAGHTWKQTAGYFPVKQWRDPKITTIIWYFYSSLEQVFWIIFWQSQPRRLKSSTTEKPDKIKCLTYYKILCTNRKFLSSLFPAA